MGYVVLQQEGGRKTSPGPFFPLFWSLWCEIKDGIMLNKQMNKYCDHKLIHNIKATVIQGINMFYT